MKTLKPAIAISGIAANTNIFDGKMQLSEGNVHLELKVVGADAETRAILKTSGSGENFSAPHEDAEVVIPSGDSITNIPFEGFKIGIFVEVHFDKQTAGVGTLTATLV